MASWQVWTQRFVAPLFAGLVFANATAANPVLSVSATPDPAAVGAPVALDVMITDVLDLYAYQFTFTFDPSVLQATSVTQGSFLTAGGATFFDGGVIDNTAGTISFVFDTIIGAGPGVSGSGILASLNFNAVQVGNSTLVFSDMLFLDSALDDITVGSNVQVLAVVPEPATLLMFGVGLTGLAAWRTRRLQA